MADVIGSFGKGAGAWRLRIGMFADKFNANNRTYPSRERRPRRSVGFDAFLRTAARAVPTDFTVCRSYFPER